MKSMYLSGLLAAGLVAMAALSSPAVAATAVTEQEAHAIGVDAYLYFYSKADATPAEVGVSHVTVVSFF